MANASFICLSSSPLSQREIHGIGKFPQEAFT